MDDLKIHLPYEIKKSKFQGLDGLRGISILLVIITHVLRNYPVQVGYLGKMGVNIFFVISGFLITTLLLKEKCTVGRISLKNFYIRRAFRILPLVYLFLAVLLFLNILYKLQVSGTSFITSFFFLRNLPIVNDWYTNHLWTLGIEEQYYLIFPFLITLLPLRIYKWLIILLIIILPPLSFVYFTKMDLNLFHFSRLLHVALGVIVNLFGRGTVLILTGSLFSILFLTGSRFINRIYTKVNGIVSLILFLLAILSCMPMFPWYIEYISEIFFGTCIAIAILLNLKEDSLFGRFLNREILKKLGVLSYSLYVWQQLFTHKQPWGGNLFLNVTLLVIVSWLSYYFYEKKFLQYKERFRKI